MIYRKSHKGAALLISMIVLAILSAWAVAINSMSGLNVQLAENQRKADSTRACAESGLDVIRYWIARVYMPGSTQPNERFNSLTSFVQTDLAANSIANMPTALDVNCIWFGTLEDPVVLASSPGQYFCAEL
ncbi:MAG: PilX N-terminal domain-containing pilus assembly protein, partial [Planctomycetota bacterium]